MLQTRTQADDLVVLTVGLPDDTSPAQTTVTADSAGDTVRVDRQRLEGLRQQGPPGRHLRAVLRHRLRLPAARRDAARQPRREPCSTTTRADAPTVTVAPDGSQTRVVYGIPADLADPGGAVPTAVGDLHLRRERQRRTDPSRRSASTSSGTGTPRRARSSTRSARTVQTVRRGLDTDLITSQTYDIDGNVTSVTDPLGRARRRDGLRLHRKGLAELAARRRQRPDDPRRRRRLRPDPRRQGRTQPRRRSIPPIARRGSGPPTATGSHRHCGASISTATTPRAAGSAAPTPSPQTHAGRSSSPTTRPDVSPQPTTTSMATPSAPRARSCAPTS